jgi:transcriptional regulator with PAS, ATPase and Fis domain
MSKKINIEIKKESEDCKKIIAELENKNKNLTKTLKNIKESLSENEDILSKLFDHAHEYLAIINESGEFLKISRSIREKMKKSEKAGDAKYFFEVIDRGTYNTTLDILKKSIKNNETVNLSYTHKNVEYSCIFIPIKFKNQNCCLWIAKEVNEYKRLNFLLDTINKIMEMIVHEKDANKLFNSSTKLLANLREDYSVWIGLRENDTLLQIAFSNGTNLHKGRTNINDYPCIKKAIKDGEVVVRNRRDRRKFTVHYLTPLV